MRGLTAAICAACVTLGGPSAAAPAPVTRAGAGLEITADAMVVNAATRVATASGRVRITDGRTVAVAERATLYHNEGRGVLIGTARVTGPQGELEGREITITYTTRAITRITARGSASVDAEDVLISAQVITIDPAAGTLVAEQKVTAFAKPDIVATGAALTYHRAEGRIVLEGAARVQNREGFLEADRLEGFRRSERVVATNNVHGRFRDIEVRSRAAEVLHAEKKAIFSGQVRLTQPGRQMATDRVTVWYHAGKVLAEGQTSVRIEPQP
jgi:lipopolysaccharide export system protein LptA